MIRFTAPGLQGPQGEPGSSITFKATVATVTALNALTGMSEDDARVVEENGHIYIYDGSSWIDGGQFLGPQGEQGPQGPQGEPGSANLNGLTDVTLSGTPSDKQILIYDNSTSQWINADPIDSTGIAYKEGVPASPTSTGQVGQLAIDGVNAILYVCTATNNWQKVSLNSANFTNVGGFI